MLNDTQYDHLMSTNVSELIKIDTPNIQTVIVPSSIPNELKIDKNLMTTGFINSMLSSKLFEIYGFNIHIKHVIYFIIFLIICFAVYKLWKLKNEKNNATKTDDDDYFIPIYQKS